MRIIHSYKNKLIPLIFLFSLLLSLNLKAQVSGPCSNCHTMHNSQHNSALVSSTQENLLNTTCAGCHVFFHGKIQSAGNNGASPWLRHPTNVAIPDKG